MNLANAVSKLISKTLAGFVLGQFFGPIGFYIGWLLGDNIGEFGIQQIEKFFSELGKETGKSLADNKDSIFKFLKQKLTSEQCSEVDHNIASLLCKIWEERIAGLIKNKDFVDKIFQRHIKLLKKYQEKFRTAQKGNSSIVFYEIFPKVSQTDFETEFKNFEAISDKDNAQDFLWNKLQKSLAKWTDEGDQEIYQSIENEIKEALTKDLQSDFLLQLKSNEKFFDSFNTSFQFFATDILKFVSGEIKETKKNTEEIIEILKPSVDYDSQELKQEVLQYLQRVAEEVIDIKTYFPTHLQNKSFQKSPFDNIRQRVSVTEKKNWDEIRARIEEKSKTKGISDFNEGKTAHKYRLTTGSDIENIQGNQIRIFDWDNKALKEFERAIFLGDPGFGKTWLLCFEAREIALESTKQLSNSEVSPKNTLLPIKLKLSTLAENISDEILARNIAKLTINRGEIEPFSKNFEEYIYQRIIAQENVVILLDALDEVPENPKQGIDKEKFRIKLERFSNDYPKISIYISSRIVGYSNLNIKDAKELELLPFEDEQIKNFTKVWFQKDKAKDERFHDLLATYPQAAGLAQIPLMLSLLCKLFDEETNEENFPETRGEIYQRCLIGLLRDWKKENERKLISKDELHYRLKFLEKLAFKLFEKQHEQFSETSFTEILCETLGISNDDFSAEETVIEWRMRLEQDGIIKKAVKGENPEYLFLHLTFQEYLAASYLAKLPNWKEFVFKDKILFSPRWQEVLTLLGGTLSKENVKDYIESLLEKNGENGESDILFRPFMLATFAAKEGKKHLEESLKEKLLTKLTDLYANPPNHLHTYYFKRVNRVWKDEMESTLLRMLSVEVNSQNTFNINIRYGAIEITHDLHIKTPVIIEQIIKILNETNSSDEKIMASITLCEAGFATPKAVDTLIDMLLVKRKANPHFGFALLEAKEFLPKVIDAFVKFVYLEDIATFSTRHLLQVLSHFNDLPENLTDSLIGILTDKKLEKHYFHEVVIDGLLNNKVTRKKNFKELLSLLGEENLDHYIRGKIARGIARHKSLTKPEIISLAKFFLEENKEFWVSYELIPELAKLSEKNLNVANALIKFAKDKSKNAYLRVYSAWRLSEIPNPPREIIDFLFDVATDVEPIPSEKDGIKFTLSRLKNPPSKVVKMILDLVENNQINEETKENLIYNLMKSENPPNEVINQFLIYVRKDIFKGTNQEARIQSLLNLKNVPIEAIEIAIEILNSEKPFAENKRDISLQLIKYLPENQKVKKALLNFIKDETINHYHRYKVVNELLKLEITRKEAEAFFQSFWDNDKSNNYNFGTTVIQEMYNLYSTWLKFSTKTANGFMNYLIERITQRKHYWQDELFWENIFLSRIASNYNKAITVSKK